MTPTPYQLGQAHGYLFKAAGDATAVYSLKGTLYFTPKDWGLLSVPNALVRGAFDALHEIGSELPYKTNGGLNAHISVFRPEEVGRIGGADKIQERGHQFSYNLGPLCEVEPDGWEGVSKVWFIRVRSPELEKLRKSYGLSPLPNDNKFDFHITVARRMKNVLRDNDVVKQSDVRVGTTCPHCGSTNTRGARAMEKHPDGRWGLANTACGDCGNGYGVDANGTVSTLDTNPERDRSKQAALISIGELNPAHPDYPYQSPLASLTLAKRYSDLGDYRSKHRILAQLLRQSPQAFAVDQPHPTHPGLTHLATGFRVHAPSALALLATGKVAEVDA